MESLRDLISLVWLREVTMTRSILWWDFSLLILFTYLSPSFEKLWKVNSNLGLLMAGFGLLFVYISVVLGNFNWIEQRVCSSFNSAIYFKSDFPFCCRNVGDWTCTWRLFWSLLLHRPLHQWCLSSYTLPTSGNRWLYKKNHSRP